MPEKDNCVEGCVAEYKRYDLTLQLTLAVRHYVTQNCTKTHFVLPEARLRIVGGDYLPPIDFLLECGEGDSIQALPCEVKASISMNNQLAMSELERLERFSGKLALDVDGTTTKHYGSQRVVLIVHQLDADRITKLIEDSQATETLRLPNEFSLREFGVTSSPKPGQGDVMLVRTRMGTTDCEELDGLMASNIVVALEDFYEDHEVLKFTPLKPPIVYTATILWQNIFTFLSRGEEELVTDIDTVLNEAQQYYGSWDGNSPIHREWIDEVLGKLCDWGLASKEGQKYRIFLKKPKEKNLKEYFCDRLCGERKVFQSEPEPKQRLLSEYQDPDVKR